MTDRVACGDAFSQVVYSSDTLEAILVAAALLAVALIVLPRVTKSLVKAP